MPDACCFITRFFIATYVFLAIVARRVHGKAGFGAAGHVKRSAVHYLVMKPESALLRSQEFDEA